jgi:hypothetical protein
MSIKYQENEQQLNLSPQIIGNKKIMTYGVGNQVLAWDRHKNPMVLITKMIAQNDGI